MSSLPDRRVGRDAEPDGAARTLSRNLALVLVAFAAGCGTPEPGRGHSDLQLEKNVFRVSYRGDGSRPLDEVRDLAMLRGADLALRHGYPYFTVTNAEAAEGGVPLPATARTTGSALAYRGATTATVLTSGVGASPVALDPPAVSYIVRCFDARPADGAAVLDAAAIRQGVGARYRR